MTGYMQPMMEGADCFAKAAVAEAHDVLQSCLQVDIDTREVSAAVDEANGVEQQCLLQMMVALDWLDNNIAVRSAASQYDLAVQRPACCHSQSEGGQMSLDEQHEPLGLHCSCSCRA